MPENETPEVKIASAGKPVAAKVDFNQQLQTGVVGDAGNNNGEGEKDTKGAAAASAADANTNVNTDAGKVDAGKKDDVKQPEGSTGNAGGTKSDSTPPAELTEDQLKAFFEKQGIKYEGLDSLKTKLAAQTPEAELTPEQKEKLAQQKEKRILDEHLSRDKATVEQFTMFKQVIAADKKALGFEKEISDLVAEGFTKEKAETLAKERYFQFTDDEINAIEDKDEKADAIRQRDLGLKKLERKGAYIQKAAKDYLDILEQDVKEKDAEAKSMEIHTSNVEDAIKKFERKMKLELGQVKDQNVDPIDFEVPDSAITSTKELLSNRSDFEKKLLTKDGHINLEFLLPHFIKSFAMDSAVKEGYLVAQDRAINHIKTTFGSGIPELGGGQQQTGKPGSEKIATYGKPKVGTPFVNNSK